MKVLHICQNYNTKLFHKVFQTISRDPRIEQVVFYPYITKQNHFKSDRFIVYAVKSLPNIFRHFFLLRALVNFINLRKNVDLKSFDIIHCHTLFNDGVVGFLASIFSERKLIISVRHSDYSIKKIKFWLHPIMFILGTKAYKFIFISKWLEKEFNSFKGVVIGNGIDNEFFKINPNKAATTTANITRLVYIGRIIKRKKLDVVIRALSYNERRLAVIGEAFPKTKWGIKQIENLKNQKNINYKPKQTPLEIIRTLDNSDIFVMPSINETFGIVYIEAMSRGLPIIYSKGTSVDGMFSSEVGIGLKSISPESIDEAINKIMSNYNYYHKNAIKEAQSYRFNNITKKIIACYD